MRDLIDRQAAIKTLEKGLPSEPLKSKYTEGITVGFGLAITWIEQLPSAQPEIIYCKDCVKHGKRFDDYPASEACPLTVWRVAEGHEYDYQFCVYAERRTDETD